MEFKIIQNFKGEINGVNFGDEYNFNTVKEILHTVENKFGECYKVDFIKNLSAVIREIWLNVDDFSYDTCERDFINSVEVANSFLDIQFEYQGSDWKIESLNSNMKNFLK